MIFAAAVVLTAAWPARASAEEPVTASFVAHYAANVPPAARDAVDFAMTIWARRVVSSVPIEVDVEWGGGLPRNVASSTEPLGYEPVGGSLQPLALANALAGRDLAPGVSDSRLLLGSGIRWYMGVDGNAPANATDMVTMVLHELGHVLGFDASFRRGGAGLTWGREGQPVGLDTGLFDTATGALVDASSADALSSATSGRIVWRGSARDSRGHAPIMYAPGAYEPSSSLSHFDDNAYPQGDPDALMTSLIRRGEVIRRIGPATLGVLRDLGWTVNAEADAPGAGPPVSSPPPPKVATPSPTAPPVAPTHVEAHRVAAAGDFGRTDFSGVDAALLVFVAAVVWILRRSLRG
ncbi:MAG: large repetitive protein [Actinomycetota bacterium]